MQALPNITLQHHNDPPLSSTPLYILGNILTLFNSAWAVTSKTRNELDEILQDTDQSTPVDAAMSLANLGNYSGAIKVLTQSTPVASIPNENKGLLDKYYPARG
eukprot:6432438-Ditylum_brightwellii.AAC.2